MARVMKLACLVLACMIVHVAGQVDPIISNPHFNCDLITNNLGPCVDYMLNGGQIPPECCNGVRNYKSMVRTTPDLQQACTCMKIVAAGLGPGAQLDRVAGIPNACGVNIGYKISTTTNCTAIP